ncbi:MAG: penicillin-binding protein 2 [Patescibacteria group bacterium]
MDGIFKIQKINGLGEVTVNEGESSLEYAVSVAMTKKPAMTFVGSSFSMFRMITVLFLAAIVLLIIVLRTAGMQILSGREYLNEAEGNRTDVSPIVPTRGKILSSEGVVLADNVASFSLWLKREFFLDESKYPDRLLWLAEVMEVTENELHSYLVIEEEAAGDILVSDGLTHEQAMLLLSETDDNDWYQVEEGTKRKYTAVGQSFGHILGYTGPLSKDEWHAYRDAGYRKNDKIGKTGLEKTYEAVLRGHPGEKRIEVDSSGVVRAALEVRDAKPGSDIILNMDYGLQSFIDGLITEYGRKNGKKRAAVIVMNPQNGAILALMSSPGFDANAFSGRVDQSVYSALINDKNLPLFQRAISGQYPSGSTFKPIVAAAALDNGVIDEHSSILSIGGIRIGTFFFPDWKAGGHGIVDVRTALAWSVNTFFYIAGGGYLEKDGLGITRLMDSAAKFGLGKPLGIDLPGEAKGFLPSAKWKEETKGEPWYIGDTYHVSIGQGDILVTPLQVAAYTSAIANGGILYVPEVADYFVSDSQEQQIEPKILQQRVASPESLEIVRQGLRMAVTTGSARLLSYLPFKVAGKTGTAQGGIDRPNHAWFTGFAPYADPSIAITVLVEEGGEGSSTAVPIAKEIFGWWYQQENN